MTFEQVETFLTIIETGNITTASEVLFVSQSTVSSRIYTLEVELKVPLIIRKKGVRNIELTPYGKEFIPIAQQWISLWKDTQKIKSIRKNQVLNIASVDIVSNFTFVSLFKEFLNNFSNIKLSINTFHSSEIHTLIENRTMDIGYVFSEVKYPDIISKPIYRELMYLICHKNSKYYDNISPQELNIKDEIFLKWGQDFQQWHDSQWNPHENPFITVNTGSLISHYLDIPNRWSIVPMSIVSSLRNFKNIVSYKINGNPPPRICYQLTHRYPKPSHLDAIKIFQEEVKKFINSNGNICTFESWMLDIKF